MEIWELEQDVLKQYMDTNGRIWRYDVKGNLIAELTNDDITDIYLWHEICQTDFERYQVIDWATIAIDTPILVFKNTFEGWVRRHFAYYDKFQDRIYAYDDGKTSWSSYDGSVHSWKNAKLKEVVIDNNK